MGQRIVMTPAKRAGIDRALEENQERREELTRRMAASGGVEMTPELWKLFLKETKKDGDCLLWTGPGYGEEGYGLHKATKQLAHRAAYKHYTGGKIKKGYIVAQTCERKRCVAEDHLVEEYVGRV